MKDYTKPELEILDFSTENITASGGESDPYYQEGEGDL